MRRVDFSVPFVAGLQRPRFAGRRAYDPPLNAERKAAIRRAYEAASAEALGEVYTAPRDVVVHVQIVVAARLPKSARRKRRWDWGLVKPDVDNVAKLVMDGLTGSAYADDVQVNALTVTRRVRLPVDGDETAVTVKFYEQEEVMLRD